MKPMMMRIIFLILFSPTVFGMDLPDKDKLQSILSELDTMKCTMQGYDTKLMELDNVKARMFSLENQVVKLQQQNNRLNMRVQQLELKSKAIEQTDVSRPSLQDDTQNNITLRPKALETPRSAKDGGQRKIRQSLSGQHIPADFGLYVAFTAGVSTGDLVNLGVHHTIIFDRVVSNIGSAYHPHSGIFLAPVKGVYFFAVTLMVSPGQDSQYLEIVVDGTLITNMYAGARGLGDYISTSRQWVLEVNKSSEVWIRTGNQGKVHGNMHTSFSGFLMFDTQ